MPEIRINLNETIRFKPTQKAHEIYYKQMEEICKQIKGLPLKPHNIDVDKEGYASMQLWKFMETFGPHIHMCAPIVCERLEIVYSVPARLLTLDEVSKLPHAMNKSIPVVVEQRYPIGTWDGGSHTKWCGSHFCVEEYLSDNVYYNKKTYNKTWRVWTDLPTEEQMEAQVWDD